MLIRDPEIINVVENKNFYENSPELQIGQFKLD